MLDVVEDVSKLSSIPEKLLNKLVTLEMFSILEGLQEMSILDEHLCEFEIGIGILIISLENNNIKFKFKPSAKFREEIVNTLKNKHNSLEIEFDDSFVEKIKLLYKGLI